MRLKQDKPSWGVPKIKEKLTRVYPDVHTISIAHAVLDRHGGQAQTRAAQQSQRNRTFPSRPVQ